MLMAGKTKRFRPRTNGPMPIPILVLENRIGENQ